MARYDIYAFNDGLVIDLQTDFLEIPGSRVVAPLVPKSKAPVPTRGLHPELEIDGESYLVATHLLAATPEAKMRATALGFPDRQDEFTRALDLLFQGY